MQFYTMVTCITYISRATDFTTYSRENGWKFHYPYGYITFWMAGWYIHILLSFTFWYCCCVFFPLFEKHDGRGYKFSTWGVLK